MKKPGHYSRCHTHKFSTKQTLARKREREAERVNKIENRAKMRSIYLDCVNSTVKLIHEKHCTTNEPKKK